MTTSMTRNDSKSSPLYMNADGPLFVYAHCRRHSTNRGAQARRGACRAIIETTVDA
jgi:hypothetical protein